MPAVAFHSKVALLLTFLGIGVTHPFSIFQDQEKRPIGIDALPKLRNNKENNSISQNLRDVPEKINLDSIAKDNFLEDQLRLKSDSQSFDIKTNRLIAEGNASVVLGNSILKASRIEFDNTFENLYAKGKVRLIRGSQFLQSSYFKYNFITLEGNLKNVYGLINLKNISEELNINLKSTSFSDKNNISADSYSDFLGIKKSSDDVNSDADKQNISDLKLINALSVNASLGRKSFSKLGNLGVDSRNNFDLQKGGFINGSISKWRFQANKMRFKEGIWYADRMTFSNDPFTPAQSRVEFKNVILQEDINGDFLISSQRSSLIFENTLKLPFSREQRIKENKMESKWVLGYDVKDRDGLYLGYNLDPIYLGEEFKLDLQTHFLPQRIINGGTNSYVSKNRSITDYNGFDDISFLDFFGLKAFLSGKILEWNTEFKGDISTFNYERFAHANRYRLGFKKKKNVPFLGEAEANLFAAYRDRVWNGSLGETDIYTSYGGFLEKTGIKKVIKQDVGYLYRIGLANYKADSYNKKNISGLWRGSLYAGFNHSYLIWKKNERKTMNKFHTRYTAIDVNPGMRYNSYLDFSYYAYENGSSQKIVGIKSGPILTLGRLEKKFFDYSKFSVLLGTKFKDGGSPFDFDEVVDLGTLELGLTQQLIGPVLLNAEYEFNIDGNSEYFGEIINSRFEARLQRRSYDVGIYYNPIKSLGGIEIRLNDFDFSGTGIPFTELN